MSEPRIAEFALSAEPGPWAAAGFNVEGSRTRIGTVEVCFADETAWALTGVDGADLDGLPTRLVEKALTPEHPPRHPIGALSIDHVVVFTADLERTVASFERSGVRCRRIREVGRPDQLLRQAFFRFGEVIAEAVEVPPEQAGPDGAARFWGLTITVADLDAAADHLGEHCGPIRDAVQAGRRIATVRREAGLGVPVALITPEPLRDPE